eukprot:m51a1_g3131 putative tkl protein kinase (1522) ;mRNA; f:254942-260992
MDVAPYALIKYVQEGDVQRVALCLQRGDPVNYETALHVACRQGCIAAAKLLIQRGADINLRNKHGQSALDVCNPKSLEELQSVLGIGKDSGVMVQPPQQGYLPAVQAGRAPRFGAPLGKSVMQGAMLPVVLEHALQYLSFCTPSPQDLFGVPFDDARVVELRDRFEAYDPTSGGPSPLVSVQDPRVVASVAVLYLRMLPHPILPPKFYATALRVAEVSERSALAQLRILVSKLPPVCRNIITSLCMFLRSSMIDVHSLATLFSKLLMRRTPGFTPDPPEPGAVRCTELLIMHADYISLAVDEPNLPANTAGVASKDFILEGIALYEFVGGRENTLSFSKGARVRLINLHRNDWLEGMCGSVSGFLPASYVELAPLPDARPTSPRSTSPGLPGPGTVGVKVIGQQPQQAQQQPAAPQKAAAAPQKDDKKRRELDESYEREGSSGLNSKGKESNNPEWATMPKKRIEFIEDVADGRSADGRLRASASDAHDPTYSKTLEVEEETPQAGNEVSPNFDAEFDEAQAKAAAAAPQDAGSTSPPRGGHRLFWGGKDKDKEKKEDKGEEHEKKPKKVGWFKKMIKRDSAQAPAATQEAGDRQAAQEGAGDLHSKSSKDEKARAESEARAKAEAEAARARARAESEARARAEAEAREKAEAEARAKTESEMRARIEAEARLRADAEARAREAEARAAAAELEAAEKAHQAAMAAAEAEAKIRREAEELARQKAAAAAGADAAKGEADAAQQQQQQQQSAAQDGGETSEQLEKRLNPEQLQLVQQQRGSLAQQQQQLLGQLQQQFQQQQQVQKQQHVQLQQQLVQQQQLQQQQFVQQLQQQQQQFMQQNQGQAQQQQLVAQQQQQLNHVLLQFQQQQQSILLQQQQQVKQLIATQQQQLAYHTQQLKEQEESLMRQFIASLLDQQAAPAAPQAVTAIAKHSNAADSIASHERDAVANVPVPDGTPIGSDTASPAIRESAASGSPAPVIDSDGNAESPQQQQHSSVSPSVGPHGPSGGSPAPGVPAGVGVPPGVAGVSPGLGAPAAISSGPRVPGTSHTPAPTNASATSPMAARPCVGSAGAAAANAYLAKQVGSVGSVPQAAAVASDPTQAMAAQAQSPAVAQAQQHQGASAGAARQHHKTKVGGPRDTTPLPPGWIEAIDARGRIYYINIVLKTSQWERPKAPAGPITAPVGGAARGMPVGAGAVGATDWETQRRMEQLRLAEEQLMQQQMQMQIEQAQLMKKMAELDAQKKLEDMRQATPNWQINHDEIEFETKIGEGGFGEVFKAKWRGTVVAVKTLKSGGDALNPKEVEKFSKEVTILRALHHPNLVLFLGACVTPRLCMVSEFMFGGSLYDLLYKKKQIPHTQKRRELALDIARAMAYLHNSKPAIIHRDLKSLNILLDEKGEHCKVCDVGLARFKETSQQITGAVGTFSWMPPEMMKGQSYTEKADVYSFGLVLYEMVSGKLPFAGLPPAQISLRVAVYDERPPLPSSCPAKWKDLITSCWATDENERPSFITMIDTLNTINNK